MTQDSSRLRDFLESNPKWIGILFAALTLLTQVGMAAAGGNVTSTPGP